jgi:NAD(P)-dependent dehydrogenase (short-subunit alcohol dehydrogenase family)
MSEERKRILVTGGSTGIGAAVVERLRRAGHGVWAASRRLDNDTSQRTLKMDAWEESDVEAAFDCFVEKEGGLDALVISHGGGNFEPVESLEASSLVFDIQSHVVGTLFCLRAAARVMERGDIVVIGSIAATQAFPECGGYSAAKAGQRMLTLTAAEELREKNLRVSLLHPGAVDTAIWDSREGFDRSKMMRPDDVARSVEHVLDAPDAAHVLEMTILPRSGTLDTEESS